LGLLGKVKMGELGFDCEEGDDFEMGLHFFGVDEIFEKRMDMVVGMMLDGNGRF